MVRALPETLNRRYLAYEGSSKHRKRQPSLFSSRRLAAHDVHKEHRNWLTGAAENVLALGNTIRTRSKMAVPRPLKRPRLGHPDVYPQDSKQKEVSFNYDPF